MNRTKDGWVTWLRARAAEVLHPFQNELLCVGVAEAEGEEERQQVEEMDEDEAWMEVMQFPFAEAHRLWLGCGWRA